MSGIKILLIVLFVLGSLFINASHIPAWFLSGNKPTHKGWKTYLFIGILFYLIILVLANITLN